MQARIKYYSSQASPLIQILCPFHDDRKTPSLTIYTNTASFYCWGCGIHGKWEDLSKSNGKLSKLTKGEQSDEDLEDQLKLIRMNLRTLNRVPALPPGVKPWVSPWRHCGLNFLRKMNSFWWWDHRDETERIIWPIWDGEGSLAGWVGRKTGEVGEDPNPKTRKYLNSPGMNVLSLFWPLPVSLEFQEKWVVLVEGPYDSLRLLKLGIPALSLLGTKWSTQRTGLLASLGIEKVVLALDSDKEGVRGSNNIWNELERSYSKKDLRMWSWKKEAKDAGNSSLEDIGNLYKAMYGRDKDLPRKNHPWTKTFPKPDFSWFVEEENF